MNKLLKRFTSLVLAALITAGMVIVPADAAEAGDASSDPISFNSIYDNHTDDPTPIIESGMCGADENGENVRWELRQSGELYIYGSGAMADYDSMNDVDSPFLNLSAPVDKIIIESGVTSVGREAFYYLITAREAVLPEGLEKISENSFLACNAMISLTIPSSVKEIGDRALGYNLSNGKYGSFNKRSDFTVIGYKDSVAQTYSEENELQFNALDGEGSSEDIEQGQCGENVFWTFNSRTKHLDVYGEGDTYDNEDWHSPFEIRTPIDESSYSYRRLDISTVTVAEGVTSIGNWMFYECSMKTISLPSTLKSINYQAFRDCEKLREINLPEGLEEIKEYAFRSCGHLQKITIPSSVKSISEEHVFSECASLKEICVDENNENYTVYSGCLYTKDYRTLLCIPHCIQEKTIFVHENTEIDNNYYTISEDSSSLETLVYPKGFKTFGTSAGYSHCKGFKNMVFQGDLPQYNSYSSSSFFYDKIFRYSDEVNIYCPLSNKDWKSAADNIDPQWKIIWIDVDSMSSTLEASIDNKNLNIGESAQITASINPTITRKILFSSSNESSVTVLSSGKVIAVAPGSADITVKTEDGSQSVVIPVTVTGEYSHCPEHEIVPLSDSVFNYDNVSNYISVNRRTYSQYVCDKIGGLYIFQESILYYYSFKDETVTDIKHFDNISSVYFSNDILYIGNGSSIIIYDLIERKIVQTIELDDVKITAVGADKSGRIYAGVYDNKNSSSYRILLYSADGELLSQTYCGTKVRRFCGFDSTNGRFYTENDYDFYSWGYNHPGYGLNMGVVTDNDIKSLETSTSFLEQGIITRSFACILYLGQDVYYDHNTYAELLGDHYLTAKTVLNQKSNIYDSNAEQLTLIMSKDMVIPEFEQEDSWVDFSSIGVRAVWNEKNDSVIMYENGNNLVEYNPNTGEKIASFKTAHPVFNLMRYKDGLAAVEKENDEYYLEFIRWNYDSDSISIICDNNTINVGESQQLQLHADNSEIQRYCSWSSSDNTVASVSKTGKVMAWKEGRITITCNTAGGLSTECTIYVEPKTAPENSITEIKNSIKTDNNISANNYTVWSNVVKSYLMENKDGSITKVDGWGDNVSIERFISEGGFKDSRTIKKELPIFGGFFSGENHNYFVFGQKNEDESDETEVMRVVKYSKEWERISSYSVYGANTYIPFDAGSLRMTETDGKLYIHTCHEMYASDGETIHHQANMTYVLNQEDMTLHDSYYDVYNFSIGYVSHSFNQFIAADENEVFRVDHGDATPRGIALTRFNKEDKVTDIHGMTALTIPGGWGVNSTGVSVGGFALSENNCLITGNAVDCSDSENYNSYKKRNVFLSVVDKKFEKNEYIWVTDEKEDSPVSVGTPQLVELGDDHFMLMWEETNTDTAVVKVSSALIDGDGRIISRRSFAYCRLSDCQPIYTSEGTVKWYVTNDDSLTIYSINPYEIKNYIIGDLDDDGEITSADSLMILRASVKLEAFDEIQFELADVDSDGTISSADALETLRYSVELPSKGNIGQVYLKS